MWRYISKCIKVSSSKQDDVIHAWKYSWMQVKKLWISTKSTQMCSFYTWYLLTRRQIPMYKLPAFRWKFIWVVCVSKDYVLQKNLNLGLYLVQFLHKSWLCTPCLDPHHCLVSAYRNYLMKTKEKLESIDIPMQWMSESVWDIKACSYV